MKRQVDTVLLKIASRCNLDCSYCYVYQGQDTTWKQQPKRLSDQTISNICDNLANLASTQEIGFATVLHGGEPLLLGFKKLKNLLESLRLILPNTKRHPIAIQSNGMLITREILDLCSKHKVSLSVSLDGVKRSNDIARFTHNGQSSFESVLRGIELLRSHPDSDFLFSGTLSVIQTQTNPIENYEFLKSIGSKSTDFLLQDGNFDHLPKGKKDFDSTEYGEWLSELFMHYINDPEPVKIRFFDDLIKIILGGNPEKEGKGDSRFGIIVIETDGEIRKNDTLRAAFESADFFDKRPNINNHNLIDVINTQEFEESTKVQRPTSTTCTNCELNYVCGGGMPLTRWGKSRGFDNPSVYCKDHQYYVNNILKKLSEYII